MSIYVWCEPFKHSQPGYTASRKPTQAGLTTKTILVTSCKTSPLWLLQTKASHSGASGIFLTLFCFSPSCSILVTVDDQDHSGVLLQDLDTLLLLINPTFFVRLAKLCHPCNCQQLRPFWWPLARPWHSSASDQPHISCMPCQVVPSM